MPLLAGLRTIRAWVFDTDGVVIDTVRMHAAAWKEAFDAFLRTHPPPDEARRRPFDLREDYRKYVDGKSGFDGAAAYLASRGLDLPAGSPDDPPQAATVWAVAAHKERLFTEALAEERPEAWPDTVRLLRELTRRNVPCAAVSASRHTRESLAAAGVIDLFRTVVDGNDAARLRLPGKPDPTLFFEAACRLGEMVEITAVVEDSLAGVEAARRGGFGLVVGVDRIAGPKSAADLHEQEADMVVEDLDELLRPEE